MKVSLGDSILLEQTGMIPRKMGRIIYRCPVPSCPRVSIAEAKYLNRRKISDN